jgi:UMF1 family MFS transporter
MTNRRAATIAWCLYDWAITPYPTIVTTFVISNYFAKAIAPDPTTGGARWSFMIALAGIAIAVLSPPLGAIADRMGHAKRGILISLAVIVACAGMLWFALPTPAFALPTLIVAGTGVVAVELGLLFYNALLPLVAAPERVGRISGWGWASAYAGGLACLAAALVLLVQPAHPVFGISKSAAANIRATGPLVALWAAAFGWPLFVFAPDTRATTGSVLTAVRLGLRDLRRTVVELRALPQLARFLVASAIYRDGVITILAIGGLYAGGTFGMGFSELIGFGIGINIAAALGAATFAWLDDWLGSKRTILLAILGLIVFSTAIIAVHDKLWFFGLAMALGVFVGPAQSASRSMAIRLSPEGQVGRVFGLYALTGRAVSFVGPALYGWVTTVTHSQRAGLGAILVLLVAGFILLLPVREPGRAP